MGFFAELLATAGLLALLALASHGLTLRFWIGILASLILTPVAILGLQHFAPEAISRFFPTTLSGSLLATLLVFPVSYLVGAVFHQVRYRQEFEKPVVETAL